MSELDILRTGFVAFIDGLWWGLRDNVGALSMYEGYSNAFRQLGSETADLMAGSGPEHAAEIATQIFTALGLQVERNGREIVVKSCPFWDRIRERGLEYAFHIEEICWRPMLEGIAEKTKTTAVVENSLRLAYVQRSGLEYKKTKVKRLLDAGKITQEEFERQIAEFDERLKSVREHGLYRFK